VYLGPDLDHARWWQGLRAGRSFVTNGPLLRVQAAGQLPGHVFTGPAGKDISLEITARLTSHDPIAFLEVIKDGEVERKVSFKEWSRTGTLGTLRFQTSGWFLVRAIADNPRTFRFASTAPYCVEVGATARRISKGSAQFFLDWTRERARRIRLEDPEQRREVLDYHTRAEKFWQDLAARATAE
jgi:TolB protein